MSSHDGDAGGADGGAEEEPPERINFAVNVEDGATVITMRGDRDTAVIVRSASGERIYLPPEDFDRRATGRDDSPYQPAHDPSPYRGVQTSPYQGAENNSPHQGVESDSPYQGVENDSPYQPARQRLPKEGLIPTADGYRIRHPEPATDVRLLR